MRTSVTAPKATRRDTRADEIGLAPSFVSRRRRRKAAHSPKFQAVIVPTTAANWWLFRVACKLRIENARKSKSRNGLSRQPGTGSRAIAGVWLYLVLSFGEDFSRPRFLPFE